MNFQELGLNPDLANNLSTEGITAPSEIQEEVFPLIREGKSVIAFAKTGTGKTLSYLAPLVQRFVFDLKEEGVTSHTWGLVLVPTRELAAQVERNLQLLTKNKLNAAVIVGGESEKKQISDSHKAAILVATPGRLLDLLDRREINTNKLKCVVFDEADRILDMGFVDEIRKIRRILPKKLQLCFLSATMHLGVEEISYEFGAEALKIGQSTDELTVDGLDHKVSFVGDHEKFHALVNFLHQRPNERGIIFSNYKDDAHYLVRRLSGLGLKCAALTSQLSQAERSNTMTSFREEKIQVLAASDLASRGLDVEGLDFVINMDMPEDPATYVHRVGRTARAGKKGIALSMVGYDDTSSYERLQKFLGKSIERYDFNANELSGPLPKLYSTPLKNQTQTSAPSHREKPKTHSLNKMHNRESKVYSRNTPSPNRISTPFMPKNSKVTTKPVKQKKVPLWKKLIGELKKVFRLGENSPEDKKAQSSKNKFQPKHLRRRGAQKKRFKSYLLSKKKDF
jgi:ATP-dependent RNA helicase RhlE